MLPPFGDAALEFTEAADLPRAMGAMPSAVVST